MNPRIERCCRRPLLILFVMMGFAVSCAPREVLRLETGEFEPSDIEIETFFRDYTETNSTLQTLSGRASVQVSEPGHSERLTVTFRSSRDYSLLKLRNNLGVEGGRIFSDPDSVVVYNRLEDEAHKMSHADAAWYYLNGVAAINLIRILHPITDAGHISDIYENKEYFLVETVRGERHFIDREHLRLRRTERHAQHPEAYSTFQFENYAEIDGYQMPRRIQILSQDEKSNIFFVLRALEINPSSLDFDPEIPGHIEIIRI